MTTLDPVTLTVIQNGLIQVCNEMDLAFVNAAFSPVISEALDRSDGIYHRDNGDLIAQGDLVQIDPMFFLDRRVAMDEQHPLDLPVFRRRERAALQVVVTGERRRGADQPAKISADVFLEDRPAPEDRPQLRPAAVDAKALAEGLDVASGPRIRAGIVGELDAAASELSDAEAMYSKWQRRLIDLEGELDEIRATSRRRAESDRERILSDARASAERIRQDATAGIAQELRRAREQLREEATQLAIEMASDRLEREINDSDRDRLIDEFIERVEQSDAREG